VTAPQLALASVGQSLTSRHNTLPPPNESSSALRRVGAADHQAGLRATADLLQAQAERARQSMAQIAAAANASSHPGGLNSGAAAAPLAWAAEQLGQLSAALSSMEPGGSAAAAQASNPLVYYIFPETAALYSTNTAASQHAPAAAAGVEAAAAAAAQLPQQLMAQASQMAQALTGAPPDQLLRSAQAVVMQQAERLGAAATAAAAAASVPKPTPTSTSTTGSSTTTTSTSQTSAEATAAHHASPASTSAPLPSSSGGSGTASPAGTNEFVGEWPSAHDDAGLLKAEESAFAASPAAAARSTRDTIPHAVAAAAAAEPSPSFATSTPQQQLEQLQELPRPVLRERRVPATPIGRAFGFASMGASLLLGTLKDNIVSTFSSPTKSDSGDGASGGSSSSGGGGGNSSFNIITESNAERLATALCRMRGAALKLGQMISIQDDTVLPPQVCCCSLVARLLAGCVGIVLVACSASCSAVRSINTPAFPSLTNQTLQSLQTNSLTPNHTTPDPSSAGACAPGC